MSTSEQIFLDLVAADLADNFGKQAVTRNNDCIILKGNIDSLSDKGYLPCVTDSLVKIAIRRYAAISNWGKETESEEGYRNFYMQLSSGEQTVLDNIIASVYESKFELEISADDKSGKIEFKVDFTCTDRDGEKIAREWPSHADTKQLDPEQLASWFNDNLKDPERFCL